MNFSLVDVSSGKFWSQTLSTSNLIGKHRKLSVKHANIVTPIFHP